MSSHHHFRRNHARHDFGNGFNGSEHRVIGYYKNSFISRAVSGGQFWNDAVFEVGWKEGKALGTGR